MSVGLKPLAFDIHDLSVVKQKNAALTLLWNTYFLYVLKQKNRNRFQ